MDDNKKLISVVVPIFNEEAMVTEIYERIAAACQQVKNYRYEIVFFDDGSTDGTRKALEELCEKHDEVKCVFYARNFGYLKNTFYCLQQAKGDCAIIIHADLQNPPELIPEFVEKWENGAQIVQGVKNKSHENRFVYFLRTIFYWIMIKFFGMKMTPHATEYELFDKSFIDVLKKTKTNNPFLRGIVSEYASNIDYIYYTQDARKKGKSKFNFNKYYDFAICGITQYSTGLPRKVILVCFFAILAIIAESCYTIISSFDFLDFISIRNAIILRVLFLAICLFIILVCVLFEFVISIMNNTIEKPFIVEEKRINY